MYKNAYLHNITTHLEKLLLFKQVFNEYIRTCQNIVSGNCLASENISNLYQYLLRNLLRFQPFVREFEAIEVPDDYRKLHSELTASLSRYETAMIGILNSMQGGQLDQCEFLNNVSAQSCALAQLDSNFIDQLRVANQEILGV